MFYALTASIVIEFLMYVVFVLAIKDSAAVEAASGAPIEEIITQQVGPVITKIVVAVALTNVMACILANILVATRLTYSMARDNMLPFSHVWRHVHPKNRTPTYAVLGLFGFSTALLLLALVSEKAFFLILGLVGTGGIRHLRAADDRFDHRSPPGHHSRPLNRARSTWAGHAMPIYIVGLIVFSLVCAALSCCRSSPATASCSWASSSCRASGRVTGLRKRLANGDAGPDYAKTHAS